MADRHPVTGEPIPPAGFPTLPDGTELRSRLAAAALLGITPPHMTTVSQRHDLTIYTARTNKSGPESLFWVLDELLQLKAERANFRKMSEGAANPTEFKLKSPRDQQ